MTFLKDKRYEAARQFLLVWAIIYTFIILESVSGPRTMDWSEVSTRRLLMEFPFLCACVALTITGHYYWLYKRYLAHRRYVMYAAMLPLFCALMILVDYSTLLLLDRTATRQASIVSPNMFMIAMLRVLVADMAFAIIYTVVRTYLAAHRAQKMLEAEHHKTRLLLLKSKIEPGFIHNILDMLSITANEEHAPQTTAYMHELKTLLQYSTNDAPKETVPVGDELAFTERYMRLQQIRIAHDVQIVIKTDTDWDGEAAAIAPMLLLPFVENAFKYGISYEHPSELHILIGVSKQVLLFSCSNTSHVPQAQQPSTGTGIANALKRLELQYKNKYLLEQKTDNGLYSVSLRLELT